MSLKKEQRVLLTLLKEIDSLCLKHKIDYYLSPRLTLCALMGRPFPENPGYGVVLMKTDDMERFRQIVQDDPGEGRALESMKNHKWFPGFYLRYEDTNTLFLNVGSGLDYAHPSLGINIFPLRTNIQQKSKRDRERCREEGWMRICGKPRAKNVKKNVRKAALFLRLCFLTGQARTVSRLYDDFCKYQGGESNGDEDDVYVMRRKKQIITYPKEIFKESVRMTLAGEEFSVPAQTEEYLNISYGKDYRNVSDPVYTQNSKIICSARISGDEFIAEMQGAHRFFKESLTMGRINTRIRRLREYGDECWKYASFCANRMNLGVKYERRKGYIKNLYKNEDYLRLEKEFDSYAKIMNKSLDKGELFAEDEEIFDIYVDVLSKTGKMVQKGKIDKLI